MKGLPPRIAIVMTSKSFGGYEINFLNLAEWLKEAGCEVYCFFPEGSRLYNGAVREGLNTTGFALKNKFDIRGGQRLAKMVADKMIDHLYLGRPSSDAILAWFCKRKNPNLKAYFNMELEFGSGKKDLWHRFLYSALDFWIVPSQFLYENAIQNVGIDHEKVLIVRSGIEADRFSGTLISKDSCRQKLGLPPGEFIVGLIGRIDPGKGQHYLVQAIALLADKGLRPHAAIVGYDPRNEHEEYYKSLLQIADKAGVRGQIHFIPFQKEVEIAYKALDAFVMASSREAYGFVTIEAMASGLLVFGTDSGGTRDLILDMEDGILWEPENPVALADKLAVALEDPGLVFRLGHAASQKVQRQFRHEDQIKTLIHLFSDGHI